MVSSEGWTVAEEEEETRSVRSPELMAWEANAAAMAYKGEEKGRGRRREQRAGDGAEDRRERELRGKGRGKAASRALLRL